MCGINAAADSMRRVSDRPRRLYQSLFKAGVIVGGFTPGGRALFFSLSQWPEAEDSHSGTTQAGQGAHCCQLQKARSLPKPFSVFLAFTNIRTDTRSQRSVAQTKVRAQHTRAHAYPGADPHLETISTVINSFYKACGFPSPAEIRAVMATDENSGGGAEGRRSEGGLGGCWLCRDEPQQSRELRCSRSLG